MGPAKALQGRVSCPWCRTPRLLRATCSSKRLGLDHAPSGQSGPRTIAKYPLPHSCTVPVGHRFPSALLHTCVSEPHRTEQTSRWFHRRRTSASPTAGRRPGLKPGPNKNFAPNTHFAYIFPNDISINFAPNTNFAYIFPNDTYKNFAPTLKKLGKLFSNDKRANRPRAHRFRSFCGLCRTVVGVQECGLHVYEGPAVRQPPHDDRVSAPPAIMDAARWISPPKCAPTHLREWTAPHGADWP